MTTTPAPTDHAASVPTLAISDLIPVVEAELRAERDAAREELAKTRAELKPTVAGPLLTCGTCYGSGETSGRDCTSCSIRAKRCTSCDHLVSSHQPDGCWYSVTVGTLDQNLVCPCAANPATTAEPTVSTDSCCDDHGDWCQRTIARTNEAACCDDCPDEDRGGTPGNLPCPRKDCAYVAHIQYEMDVHVARHATPATTAEPATLPLLPDIAHMTTQLPDDDAPPMAVGIIPNCARCDGHMFVGHRCPAEPADEPKDELCSDKNGFHGGHDWTPDPCEPYRWCPGYPVPAAS